MLKAKNTIFNGLKIVLFYRLCRSLIDKFIFRPPIDFRRFWFLKGIRRYQIGRQKSLRQKTDKNMAKKYSERQT